MKKKQRNKSIYEQQGNIEAFEAISVKLSYHQLQSFIESFVSYLHAYLIKS